MNKKLLLASCGATIAAAALASTTAFATPGNNAPLPVPNPPPTWVLDGPLNAAKDNVQLKVNVDTTVRAFNLNYAPKSHSGWHRHPGIVLVLVEKGTVVRETEDCKRATFHAGQAFTEVLGHRVSNPSATQVATLRITQLFPASTDLTKLREDIPIAPRCT
jgi:quercetin dioxygenase-like cupin family protein